MADYTERLAAVNATLREKGRRPTDLLRAAGMMEAGEYVWGLRVLRDGGRGEPTLRRLERALVKLCRLEKALVKL